MVLAARGRLFLPPALDAGKERRKAAILPLALKQGSPGISNRQFISTNDLGVKMVESQKTSLRRSRRHETRSRRHLCPI
jgi:hypothetical protein